MPNKEGRGVPDNRIDADVRALLRCPRCRGDLTDIERGLACVSCAVWFPVEDGIPFLVDECAKTYAP